MGPDDLSAKHALTEYAPLIQDGRVANFTPTKFTLTIKPRRFAIEYLGFKNSTQVYLGATNFVVTTGAAVKPNITPVYSNANSSVLAGLIYSNVSLDGVNWTYTSYYVYKNDNASTMKFACDLYAL